MRYAVCAQKTRKTEEPSSTHLFSFDLGDEQIAIKIIDAPPKTKQQQGMCLEVWGEAEASFMITILKEEASNTDVARFFADPFTTHSIYQKPSLNHGVKVKVGEGREKTLDLPNQTYDLAKSLAHGIHVKEFYLVDGRPMARLQDNLLMSRVDNHYHRKSEFIEYFKEKSVFLGEFKASSHAVKDAFKHLG